MPTTTPTNVLELHYAPIQGDLAHAVRVFDAELVSEQPFVNQLCETVRSYRGKMLRPALLLLSARATGECNEKHHTLAAVVEMVHMATLVHDDVLDEADQRRQHPTIASRAGNTAAVLLGVLPYKPRVFIFVASWKISMRRVEWVRRPTWCVKGELLQNRRRHELEINPIGLLRYHRAKDRSTDRRGV